MTTPFSEQLATLLGPEAVLATGGYAVDGLVPQAVVRPANRDEVSSVLRWASSVGAHVFPRGGGVFTHLGNVPSRVDVVLDLSSLDRVIDFQPEDLTVSVEAGITLEALRRELTRGGKYVPLEAPLPHLATVGGILATGYSGPMRYSYGLPRDWLIGISVVGSDGVETRAGGRVVKNVTGYDLNKLYSGSLGTLGVMVEASFKLAPQPETWAGVTASFPSVPTAVAAGRSLVARVYAPQGLQVVSAVVAEKLGLAAPGQSGAMALAFMSGRPRAVARRVQESARLLAEAGATGVDTLDEPSSTALLARLTDLGSNAGDLPDIGLKINLPPDNVGKLLEALGSASSDIAPGVGIVADPGFGVVQLLGWQVDFTDSHVALGVMGLLEQARHDARGLGGTVVVEIFPPDVKAGIDVFEGAAGEAELEIMRRTRRNLDPAGILNPGRSIGRL